MKSRAIVRLKVQDLYQKSRDVRDELELVVGSAHPALALADKACLALGALVRELGGK